MMASTCFLGICISNIIQFARWPRYGDGTLFLWANRSLVGNARGKKVATQRVGHYPFGNPMNYFQKGVPFLRTARAPRHFPNKPGVTRSPRSRESSSSSSFSSSAKSAWRLACLLFGFLTCLFGYGCAFLEGTLFGLG